MPQYFDVGRDPRRVQIVTPSGENSVSRVHARIETLGDGKYLVRDLGSTTGTFRQKNGGWDQIQQEVLHAQAHVRLGHYETTVKDLLNRATTGQAIAPPKEALAVAQKASIPKASEGDNLKYDVFVSYSTGDAERVAPIIEMLRSQGWSVFWDRDLQPGKQWDRTLDSAIRNAASVVVIWTKASVQSDFVRAEAMIGYDRKVLVPLRLEPCEIPLPFGIVQSLDLSRVKKRKDEQALLTQLLATVSRLVQKPAHKGVASNVRLVRPQSAFAGTSWSELLFDTTGRINSAQYTIGNIIISMPFLLVLLFVEAFGEPRIPENCDEDCQYAVKAAYSGLCAFLSIIYPLTILTIKRLHDFGWSGWFAIPVIFSTLLLLIALWALVYLPSEGLLYAICFIGIFTNVLLSLLVTYWPSSKRPNRYGPMP